ncbi:Sterile alpha motif domain-containing protein 15 [Lemmus lemmus]
MAEVPEDYHSDPDEIQEPKRTKSPRSHKLYNSKSDTAVEVTPELLPEIDQEPEKLKTEEDDFEEGKPGSAETSARTPEEEFPKDINRDLPSQTEAEITQVLTLETSLEAGGEDLEVPVVEKQEEPDLQPPDVSVDVLFTEPPTETDIQLPTETKTPEATSSEKILTKSVEEEDLPPLKMTKSEITKTQEESAEEKSTEPSEVTKPEFPGQTLRKSTEEADVKPPEEIRMKSTEQIGQKPKQSIEEKVPLSGEESRKPIDEASLERSERATSEVPKETQSSIGENIPETLEVAALGLPEEIGPDVEGETQEKSVEEKVPESSEDRKPAGQKEKQRKASEKSKSKGTLVESHKAPVLQEQMDADLPKKNLQKSTEETGQGPPQMTKPEVQEKSQPAPTKELELSNEPKPGTTATELPKDHRPGLSKLKYPVGKDELAKNENEFMVGSPRESVESDGTDYESHELLKVLQTEANEALPTDPASVSCIESRDSVSEKKVVLLPKWSEKMGLNESKINKSVSPSFEHLKWTAEKVAEWIGELGFPQYKVHENSGF